MVNWDLKTDVIQGIASETKMQHYASQRGWKLILLRHNHLHLYHLIFNKSLPFNFILLSLRSVHLFVTFPTLLSPPFPPSSRCPAEFWSYFFTCSWRAFPGSLRNLLNQLPPPFPSTLFSFISSPQLPFSPLWLGILSFLSALNQ